MFARCPQLARPAFLRQSRSQRLLQYELAHSPRFKGGPATPKFLRPPTVHYPLTTFLSSLSELLVAQKKIKPFVFNKIQTLFAKHRGWGYPPDSAQRNQQLPDFFPPKSSSRSLKTPLFAA